MMDVSSMVADEFHPRQFDQAKTENGQKSIIDSVQQERHVFFFSFHSFYSVVVDTLVFPTPGSTSNCNRSCRPEGPHNWQLQVVTDLRIQLGTER